MIHWIESQEDSDTESFVYRTINKTNPKTNFPIKLFYDNHIIFINKKSLRTT